MAGLELGADYITKPFSPRQLVARVQAVMRRAGKSAAPAVRQVGDLALDPMRRELRVVRPAQPGAPGGAAPLTALECRLLDYMMLNAGHVLTTEAILDHVWGARWRGSRHATPARAPPAQQDRPGPPAVMPTIACPARPTSKPCPASATD